MDMILKPSKELQTIDKKWTLRTVYWLMHDVSRGIHYMHDKGLVHNDIKVCVAIILTDEF